MDKKMNNEELQSRREFFKKAAKAALPMIAAITLASAPAIVNAATAEPMGCSSDGCSYTCNSSCHRGCYSGCQGTCKSTCTGGCRGGYTNLK